MEETFKQLYERFPLLSRLFITRAGYNFQPESLPAFLGFVLAVMDAPPDTPLCFVLPRCGDIARIMVVLHALNCFVNKQKELTHSYGETQFSKGDTIRVHPGKQVFIYDGFDHISSDSVWLKTLNGTGRWMMPAVSIIPRLEKTTLTRPIGRLNSPLPSPPPAHIDLLLGTSTFGNPSIVQNEAVILDSQNGFADFAETIVLQLKSAIPEMPPLKSLLPLGELSQPGSSNQSWLTKWDSRNAAGEPLIAVAHSAELLANFCIDSPAFKKLVVINGLSRLRNRQAYDDIAGSQRVILFASCDEVEMIEALGQAPIPCKFWWLSAAEINAGRDESTEKDLTGSIGKIVHWAKNHEDLHIESVPCDGGPLEDVYVRLAKLRGQMSEVDNDPLTKLVSRAWRILNNASALIRPPNASERQRFALQIASLRDEIKSNAVWLKPESMAILSEISNELENSLLPSAKVGVAKAGSLYRLISEELSAGRDCALLARDEYQVEYLDRWLRERGFSLDVYSRRTLPDDNSFDCLICVSWLGGDTLKQVAEALLAPRIRVLTYTFESRWLNQCNSRLRSRPSVPGVTSSEKSSLVFPGKSAPSFWQDEKPVEKPTEPSDSSQTDIWNLEQRLRTARKGAAASPTNAVDTVPARYISFVGDAFAFLTETHKVSIATEIASARLHQSQKLPERTILEIKAGDFLVFPASGDRELVQELADKLIGPTAPQLRKLARMWKDVLQASGMTPEQFLAQARNLNRPQHRATIRYWFADNLQIGPRDKDDLFMIALVTNNELLDANAEAVWSAIEKLRGAHLGAGVRLRAALLQRLPQVINQVEENGTKIDLAELGSAWVLQVESIAPQVEPRGRNELNRLLWERTTSIASYA